MNWFDKIANDTVFHKKLINFLNRYGIIGLEHAIDKYKSEQKYVCKTKTSITKIDVDEIYYLSIRQHSITIYTQDKSYNKYGTLSNELNLLAPYGFVKCNQSQIVSLNKIKSISGNKVLLINDMEIQMSRNCASKVISSFTF